MHHNNNSMKKAIIIVRTLRSLQGIDYQRNELIKYALSDGYKPDELEVIDDAGSYTMKQDERYTKNINKIYSMIKSSSSIECVYAWTIDCIGRKEVLLMNFKKQLIEKGINLKIITPSLYLLENDGSVNPGMELAFSLFATMVKQEMEQKKERLLKAKIRNSREGKFNGGPETRYGYTVENGYFTICHEEAEMIKMIFMEYATGNYSMQKLATELNNRGLRHRDKTFNVAFIHTVLNDETFIGAGNKAAIIDNDLFEKVKYIRENQTSTLLTKESKYTHLATKLLKCRECGHNYIANYDRYCCYKHRFNRRFDDVCNNDLCIRINLLDSLLWEIVKQKHQQYLSLVEDIKVEEKKKIVNQHIKSIYLDKTIFKDKPAVLITINDEIKILYDPRSKRKKDNNLYFWENEKWIGKYRF